MGSDKDMENTLFQMEQSMKDLGRTMLCKEKGKI